MKNTIMIFALLLATTLSAAAECSDSDRKALEAFDHASGKAGQDGDKATLIGIYADDYLALPGMEGKAVTIDNTMSAFERNSVGDDHAPKHSLDSGR